MDCIGLPARNAEDIGTGTPAQLPHLDLPQGAQVWQNRVLLPLLLQGFPAAGWVVYYTV